MMLQLGDDGVVTSVNEEELVYVDKNELEQLIENYQQLEKENEQLKSRVEYLERKIDRERTSYQKQHEKWEEEIQKENEQLKQTISKIDFAIIRKYDNSLENLLDEIYDGEYNNWIQKQLLRAKKLEKGDVE